MRNQQLDILGGKAIAIEQFPADVMHFTDSVPENLLPFLLHVVQFLFDGLVRGRHSAAASGHVQVMGSRTVNFVQKSEEGIGIVAGGLFNHHRSRPIAEEYASRAVRVIDDARHGIGTHDEHLSVRSGRTQVSGCSQTVDKAGAGGADIEAPRAGRAQSMLHKTRSRRKHVVRSDCADENRVEFRRLESGARESRPTGFDRHVGRCHIRSRDVALANSRSIDDPRIAGVDHFRQIVVGQQTGRRITANGRDASFGQLASTDEVKLQ